MKIIPKHTYMDAAGVVWSFSGNRTKNGNLWGKQVYPPPAPGDPTTAFTDDGVCRGKSPNLVGEVRQDSGGVWLPVPVSVPPAGGGPMSPMEARHRAKYAGDCVRDGHKWVDTGMRRIWCGREGCAAEKLVGADVPATLGSVGGGRRS